eukprot:scaffold34373_cov17-Tisochrysis_lutea.AAC.1
MRTNCLYSYYPVNEKKQLRYFSYSTPPSILLNLASKTNLTHWCYLFQFLSIQWLARLTCILSHPACSFTVQKVQVFVSSNGRVDLALTFPSLSMRGKNINEPEGLGMDSPALSHLTKTAIGMLGAADQEEFAKDGWHRSGQVWTGFLHVTLATLTVDKKLPEIQRCLKSAHLDVLMKTPLKCKPGGLFFTKGDKKKDRPKIILKLVFEADDDQRVKHIADTVKEAVGATNFQEKTSNLHMIIAKNYGAPRNAVPDQNLLFRLGEQLKALDLTVSFGRLAVSAAGSELGYAVDPSLPTLCKLPVVYWQDCVTTSPVHMKKMANSFMIVSKQFGKATVLDDAIKGQEAHATTFLKGAVVCRCMLCECLLLGTLHAVPILLRSSLLQAVTHL